MGDSGDAAAVQVVDTISDAGKKTDGNAAGGDADDGDQPAPASPEKRDRWDSRWSFILAAIGSAIGLGNFWRFPYLVYAHGGGPFLIPYWLLLFVVGIPMLLLETVVGQKFQSGDVSAFGSIHPTLRGVGLASVFAAFLVVIYYTVVISWSVNYFVESFMWPMPWEPWGKNFTKPCGGVGPFGDHAAYHLHAEVLHDWDEKTCKLASQSMQNTPAISGTLMGCTIFTWFCVGAGVLLGVRTASKLVWVTVPGPILIAAILVIRALSLDGADDGVHAYIGKWDFSRLNSSKIWIDACGQIFFTLSVCWGIMTTYGSYNKHDSPVLANAFIISLANCVFSFFVGFAVFGTLGHMAYIKTDECRDLCVNGATNTTCWNNCKVAVEDVAEASLSLVYVAYPTVLASFGKGTGNFFAALLFLMLFMLGWDSAFSMVEAVTTVFLDSKWGGKTMRKRINDLAPNVKFCACGGDGEPGIATPVATVIVCIIGILFGLLFTSEIGNFWLDFLDHYLASYTILLDGVFQCIAVCWVWGMQPMYKSVGKTSARWFVGSWTAFAFVFILLTTTIATKTAPCNERKANGECKEYGVGGEVAIGLLCGVLVLVPGWTMSFMKAGKSPDLPEQKDFAPGQWFSACAWAGADEMMDFVAAVGRNAEGQPLGAGSSIADLFSTLHRYWWSLTMKYISPILLTFLIIVGFKADVKDPYGGYEQWMQNVGWIMVCGTLAMFVGFLFCGGDWPEPKPNPSGPLPKEGDPQSPGAEAPAAPVEEGKEKGDTAPDA